MTSYRSTPAITKLFAQLAQNNSGMSISSVQRSDKEPEITVFANETDLENNLERLLKENHQATGLTAIVVKDNNELTTMWSKLQKNRSRRPALFHY